MARKYKIVEFDGNVDNLPEHDQVIEGDVA